MPLAHRKLAAWYHQLAQQLQAGLPLADAVRLSRGTGAPSQGLETIAATIERGGSVEEGLRTADAWLPQADRLFLSAAAAAGRMPSTLQLLSARHARLGAAKLRTVLACLYPAALLHLGLALFPLLPMMDWEKGFSWDPAAYLRGLALALVPLWTVVLVLAFMIRRQNPAVARALDFVPFVGRYLRAQALSDFAFALGNLLEAGVPIDRAWAAAGDISRSSRLKNAADEMGTVIARGEPPGPQLAATGAFPPDFAALYRGGEVSGQLEQNLLRLSAQHQDEAQRALTTATIVYPGLLFLVVAAGVGYFAIKIYGGYLKMLTSLAEG